METIVVKIGGIAADNLDDSFFAEIHKWQKAGKKVVIIHGGGYYISQMMARLGVEVTIRDGLRVTDAATLEITRMVLLGQVQPIVTTKFFQAGFHGVGLSGGSDQLLLGTAIDEASLGYVGEIQKVNTDLLEILLEKNQLPIIAPLAISKTGQWLNINADEVACQIAAALQASQLFLLTDVPGIKDKDHWLKEVSIPQLDSLVAQKVISGGMLPKIQSGKKALLAGVQTVHINNCITKCGTQLVARETVAV